MFDTACIATSLRGTSGAQLLVLTRELLSGSPAKG